MRPWLVWLMLLAAGATAQPVAPDADGAATPAHRRAESRGGRLLAGTSRHLRRTLCRHRLHGSRRDQLPAAAGCARSRTRHAGHAAATPACRRAARDHPSEERSGCRELRSQQCRARTGMACTTAASAAAAQDPRQRSAERQIEQRQAEAARQAAQRAAAARERRLEAERRRVDREQRRAGSRSGATPLPVPVTPSMPAASGPKR